MDADVRLLQSVHRLRLLSGQIVSRIYTWDGVWVSLGRFQDPAKTLSPGFAQFVMRPTGGKAVLHGHDITVSLATPFQGRSVKTAYVTALRPVLCALNACGLQAKIAGQSGVKLDSAEDCFASTSPYDIICPLSKRKVAGAAMLLSEQAMLMQVSIPYRQPQLEPWRAIQEAVHQAVPEWDWHKFGETLRKELVTIAQAR